MQLVLKEQPILLVFSSMCTAFSRWQSLNVHKRDKELVEREWRQALVHLSFACELMKVQLRAGRYFLYEHPLAASSWSQTCVQEVMKTQTSCGSMAISASMGNKAEARIQ